LWQPTARPAVTAAVQASFSRQTFFRLQRSGRLPRWIRARPSSSTHCNLLPSVCPSADRSVGLWRPEVKATD